MIEATRYYSGVSANRTKPVVILHNDLGADDRQRVDASVLVNTVL